MLHTIAILGRQPALGLAELESLYGASAITPLSGAALLNIDPKNVAFDCLGGSLKLAKHLTTLNTTDWTTIVKYLVDTLPQHLQYIPEGKIRFGLSVYGLSVKPATLNRSGLEIKKIIKQNGRSVRVVPNTTPELNTAQTIHNQLTGPTGMELVLVRHGKQTLLGQVTHVQDINAYAARDQKRPMRDAKVGMLPPKLAQIIINLSSTYTLPSIDLPPHTEEPVKNSQLTSINAAVLLDPFCGTGVVLQEALLRGYRGYGTDLEPRMIEYTEANLKWLDEKHTTEAWKTEVGDATNHTWQPFDLIATETYLGRPFSVEPKLEVLQEVIQDVDTIHRKFLKNVGKQTRPGFKMCIAVPAWKSKAGFKHLKVLDSLEEMGYTRMSFVHVFNDQLIYHRPDQIVARELVVLTRN